jgi:hypothetical protein
MKPDSLDDYASNHHDEPVEFSCVRPRRGRPSPPTVDERRAYFDACARAFAWSCGVTLVCLALAWLCVQIGGR